jgi:hypothetical protein
LAGHPALHEPERRISVTTATGEPVMATVLPAMLDAEPDQQGPSFRIRRACTPRPVREWSRC